MTQTLKFATRMDAVQPPIVPIIGEMIRQSPGTISLGQGVVHYGPPAEAMDAARTAAGDVATHQYGDGSGLSALVDRLSEKLGAENGITGVGAESRVMVTAGANMAFMHAILAITQPGDEIILPVPFYFNHEMAIQMAGCVAVTVPTDDRYQLRLDAIRAALTPRTRAIVTISPNNPSGAVLGVESLREVGALCAARGLYHISDETYEYFTYGSARHVSPASLPGAAGHTITLFSLSKAYGFAGWRIGYLAYPDAIHDAMLKVQDTILICPTIIAQVAALAALNVGHAYCAPRVLAIGEVRDLVLRKLSELGPLAHVPPADGALYCFLKVNTNLPPLALAERLIRDYKVAVIPGPAFGMADGCYFRVAFGALQKDTVAEGIGRFVTGLQQILKSSNP